MTINTPEKRLGVPAAVTRPYGQARDARLPVGARAAVGPTAFRVLPDFTLATGRGSRAAET